jgi:hypothetical protein
MSTFFYDEELLDMLETGFGGTWFSTLFDTLLPAGAI